MLSSRSEHLTTECQKLRLVANCTSYSLSIIQSKAMQPENIYAQTVHSRQNNFITINLSVAGQAREPATQQDNTMCYTLCNTGLHVFSKAQVETHVQGCVYEYV